MRNILLVIKSNLYRCSKNSAILFMAIIVMTIIVGLGVYFGGTDELKGKIAVVGVPKEQEDVLRKSLGESNKIDFEFLDESLTKTSLIRDGYLVEINYEGGEPKVRSYGNEEVKKYIEASLNGEVYEGSTEKTTVQGKIVGFLIMFLSMGATMVLQFLLEDRKNKVYTRTLIAGVSYYEYIIGQVIYALLGLGTPTILISAVVVKVLGVSLNISYLTFIGLVFLAVLISVAYGIFLCNLFKNEMTVEIVSSNFAMILCLFSGSIININDTNKFIGFIRNCLPQKRLIDLANSFNRNDLIFVIIVAVILIGIAIIKGKKDFEEGAYI